MIYKFHTASLCRLHGIYSRIGIYGIFSRIFSGTGYATSYTDKRSIYSGSRDNYKLKLIPAKVICIAKSTCICPDLFEILAKAYIVTLHHLFIISKFRCTMK